MCWCPCMVPLLALMTCAWLSHWYRSLRFCLRMLADCIYPIRLCLATVTQRRSGSENTEGPQYIMVWLLSFEICDDGWCESDIHAVETILENLNSDSFRACSIYWDAGQPQFLIIQAIMRISTSTLCYTVTKIWWSVSKGTEFWLFDLWHFQCASGFSRQRSHCHLMNTYRVPYHATKTPGCMLAAVNCLM